MEPIKMQTLNFILPRVGDFFFKLGNGILEFPRDLSGKGVVLKKKPADQIPPTQNYGGYQQSEVPADW